MTKCLADSALHRYHAKEMPSADESRVRAHLESCSSCAARSAKLVAGQNGLIQELQKAELGEAGATASVERKKVEPTSRPERIGAYKILEQLGVGGMGEVYLAEQTEPIRRRVALKLIKLGMDTKQVIARFETERQALALMNHPNVAKVLDAGATEKGRPYFVMEYVKGESITAYCDRHRLTTKERLELFMQVCHAVQHAHQKGIIHRDLKPSNVLVAVGDVAAGAPAGREKAGAVAAVPKVIDFGVAKATEHKLTERTLFTEQGQLIGTPEYMSPEQAEMTVLDIDTRTDIYSLGVLLYELLVGALPFDPTSLRQAAFAEIQRIIREEDPPKPSTRLSSMGDDSTTAAHKRRTDHKALQRQLRGDLDWITMRAMDKDRTRRYATASEFADDIARHLRHEPVLASPPSAAYRARKFIRRNKGPVAIAAVFMLLIITAGVTFSILWRQAERDRKRVVAINEFVTKALVSSDPHQRGRQDFKVTEAMDQAIEQLDAGELSHQPETEAALRLTISHILNGNARSQEGLRLAERALDINKQLHTGDHPDVATSLTHVGTCLYSLARNAEALSAYEEALSMRRRLFSGDHPDVAGSLDNVALCLHVEWGADEALPKHEAALAMRQRLFPGDHPDVTKSLSNLANCLLTMGRFNEALPTFEAALAMSQRLFPDGAPTVAWYLNNTGLCLQALRRPAEALTKYEAALEMNKQIYHGDHAAVGASLNNVAMCLRALGRAEEALTKHEAALEMYRRLLPPEAPVRLSTQIGLAKAYVKSGRFADAASLLHNAGVQIRSEGMLWQLHGRAVLRISVQLYDDWHAAEPDQGYDVRAAEWRAKMKPANLLKSYRKWANGPNASATDMNAYAWRLLTCVVHDLRDPVTALEFARKAVEASNGQNANTLDTLALAQQTNGDIDAAIETQTKAVGLLPPGPSTRRSELESNLVKYLLERQRFATAEPYLLAMHEQIVGSPPRRDESPSQTQESIEQLANFYESWHAAEPGKGYDAKAAEWRAKLAATDAGDSPE